MKNVVIFGSSGHGSVVLDCLEREKKYNVVGFIDDFKKKGSKKNGYEILGNIFDLPEVIEKFNLIGGIVAIGDNWARNLVLEKVVKIAPDFNFISAIHPNATIGKDVVIGIGTSIMPGVIINANSVVGDFCMLNTNSSLGHDGYMNDYSSLAPGVCTGGNLLLGKYSAISIGSKVTENISIGAHTVIGAGSLVLEDIPSHTLSYGSPARFTNNRKPGEKYLNGARDIPKVINIASNL